jgi:hypothetical protein
MLSYQSNRNESDAVNNLIQGINKPYMLFNRPMSTEKKSSEDAVPNDFLQQDPPPPLTKGNLKTAAGLELTHLAR